MTEISLIVTLNNQYTIPYYSVGNVFYVYVCKWFPHQDKYPHWDPWVKSRICPPYTQRVVNGTVSRNNRLKGWLDSVYPACRKRRLNGMVSQNNRIKGWLDYPVYLCRCLGRARDGTLRSVYGVKSPNVGQGCVYWY